MPAYSKHTEGIDIVLVGAFNPAILHPEWLLRHGLAKQSEVDGSNIEIVTHEVTKFSLEDINITCLKERLTLGSENMLNLEKVKDLSLGILELLPHTPTRACGINPNSHYKIENSDYWHKIGHSLAPKEPIWSSLLENPGMASLIIKAPSHGEHSSEVNVTVEPSRLVSPGLFIRTNTHFSFNKDSEQRMIDQVRGFFDAEWELATTYANTVAEKIFSEIRPHDA